MSRFVLRPLLSSLVVFALAAESQTREPLRDNIGDVRAPVDWDLESRIADRFDPVKNRARAAALEHAQRHYRGAQRAAQGDAPPPNGPDMVEYVIDGRRNPELFLPHELFDHLLSAFVPDKALGAKQRNFYGAGLSPFGFDPATFWDELATVAADYVAIRYGSNSFATHAEKRTAVCRSRYEALGRVRDHFGSRRFDQFLYAVIAPTSLKAGATNEDDPADDLRQNATGCF